MDKPNPQATPAEAVTRLEDCRLFTGTPKDFWPRFASTCGELVQAAATAVLRKTAGEWKIIAGWPSPREFPLAVAGPQFASLADKAQEKGLAGAMNPAGTGPGLLLIGLVTGEDPESYLLAVAAPQADRDEFVATGSTLRLAADTPLLYLRQRLLEKTRREVENFSQALEILAATNAHTRFLSVSMALVNELASRFKCSRVSLGWSDGVYVRVQAISGTDRFEKRMEVVQRLEAAMEEARDQDEEVVWPAPDESTAIVRDHVAYAQTEKVSGLLSVPIRVDGEPRGVLTLERVEGAFGEFDALALRVIADQVARRLDDLRRMDRWFGARWAAAAKEWFAGFLGPKQTWLKVGVIAGALLLAFATLVPLPYHVEAPFIVRADALQQISAPFEAYIASVEVRPGDLVRRGEFLLKFDSSDLLVEEAGAAAELQRYESEAEKAEADRELADLQVARANVAQATARLDVVRYHLERSEIHAPFDGVVIEGDLREKIGSPVKAGDILFKISQLKGLFVEMRVPERDIDQISASRSAKIAFASRPEDTFPVRIERIQPSAIVEKDENVFLARGQIDRREDWFRPGMSGIAKIEAGNRVFLWIATHRLVDFLRLKLWW